MRRLSRCRQQEQEGASGGGGEERRRRGRICLAHVWMGRRRGGTAAACSLLQAFVLTAAALLEVARAGAGEGAQGTAAQATGSRLLVRASIEEFQDRGSREAVDDNSQEQIAAELQRAKSESGRGRRALMMIATPMLVGGLGEGIVVLLAFYLFLFLTVRRTQRPFCAATTVFACLCARCACGSVHACRRSAFSLAAHSREVYSWCCSWAASDIAWTSVHAGCLLPCGVFRKNASPVQCFVGCNVQGGWKLYCPVFIVVCFPSRAS